MTKKSFSEYILGRLREIEVLSAALTDLQDILAHECETERTYRGTAADAWECRAGSRRDALRKGFRAARQELRVFALLKCRGLLEKRRAVLSDEVTRAACVNALRGIARAMGDAAPSGAEIARRWPGNTDAIALTNWLRNIDLARSGEFWKTRRGGQKPPKFTLAYFLTFVAPGMFGTAADDLKDAFGLRNPGKREKT